MIHSFCPWVFPKRNGNISPCKDTYTNTHNGLIQWPQNGKQSKGPSIVRKTKHRLSYNRIKLSNKIEWSTNAFNNIVDIQNYYTEWMKQEHKNDTVCFHLYKILEISIQPIVTTDQHLSRTRDIRRDRLQRAQQIF